MSSGAHFLAAMSLIHTCIDVKIMLAVSFAGSNVAFGGNEKWPNLQTTRGCFA